MDENENRGKLHVNHVILQNGFFHLSLLLNITLVFFELKSCAWSQNTQFCSFFKIHFQMANILASMIGKLFLVLTWREKLILCWLANWQKCTFKTPWITPHILSFKTNPSLKKKMSMNYLSVKPLMKVLWELV